MVFVAVDRVRKSEEQGERPESHGGASRLLLHAPASLPLILTALFTACASPDANLSATEGEEANVHPLPQRAGCSCIRSRNCLWRSRLCPQICHNRSGGRARVASSPSSPH